MTEAIVQGFRDGDASRLADLMRSPFVIGYWASEGFEREPLIAARLLLDEAGPDGTVELRMHADPATVVGPAWEDMFGPTVDVEAGFVLDGWGDDDRGAAVAYLTRMPDGRLVWHGIVINRLGEA